MRAHLPAGDFNMPPGVSAADIPGNRPRRPHDLQDEFRCAECGAELKRDEWTDPELDGLCRDCHEG